MEGMLLAREDVTDKHVMTSFAAIIGLACTLGVPAYISYWYMTTYQQIAFCAVSVPLLIYALAKWIREQNALAERRVMLVLASYDEKAKDGMSRYDANEAIAVANSFEFAGIQVVYASVQGGKCVANHRCCDGGVGRDEICGHAEGEATYYSRYDRPET